MKNTGVKSPVDTAARKELDIRAGDTIRVWQKIEEGKDKTGKIKFRLQAFEGLVIARKHGTEAGGTFTVRRVTGGIGVEKIFPLYTPMIDSIELLKRSTVRRAKLYYIREKVAREARRQLRKSRILNIDMVMTNAKEEVAVAPEAEVQA